jgi:hypothetical protein
MATCTHIVVLGPNGDSVHWLVALPTLEANAEALAEAGRRFPGHRCHLRRLRVFGKRWAIVFVSARPG